MTEHPRAGLTVGDEVEVDVTAIAHGGHCIARHEGQVLFVRHTIPGERVLARVTETGAGERFVRADAVAVRTPSPDRVVPPCPFAGPGLCGGCDLQHVSLARQRTLKADVVREQMSRLAHLEVDVEVRTGSRGHRRARLAHPRRVRRGCRRAGPGCAGTVRTTSSPSTTAGSPPPASTCCASPRAGGPGSRPSTRWPRRWGSRSPWSCRCRRAPSCPSCTSRWRPAGPHPTAAGRRCRASWPCRRAASGRCTRAPPAPSSRRSWMPRRPRPGERALDLYAGVGLFAAALAVAVGPDGPGRRRRVRPRRHRARPGQPRRPARRGRADRPGRRRLRGGAPARRGSAKQRGSRPRKPSRSALMPTRCRRRRARPTAHRRRPRGLRRDRGPAPAGRRLRRVRPGSTRARHGIPRRPRATGWPACAPSTPSR